MAEVFPLNPAQRAAVEHHDGPLLVLAGAGSGKTRVITLRIVRLLERGIPPHAICALTFTNKAAGEMRERIGKLLGRQQAASARALTVSTFHSFGLNVLTRERTAAGGAFTIFDQGDALGTVKEVLRGIKADKNYDAQAILARISNAKNAFIAPGELAARDSNDEYDEITNLVYPHYQAALRQFRAFDFDDLVCEVARLWASRPDVLGRWQERYRYLLVDEYQDTNRAQLEMLRLLASAHKNLCVVGDDDQSIYAWRGADVRNILEFDEHFPGAEVVKLEQNYRSRAPILEVANAVIAKRVDTKYKKVLFTDRAGGHKVKLLVAPSPEVEARHVAKQVARLVRDQGKKPRDIAVLYRSNGQSKAIEEGLREHGISHRVVGGQQFFERKEVKDLLAYVKLAVNAADEISLRRILNYPARGIGETSVEKLATFALAQGWSLWQAVERVDALDEIAGSAREGCKQLERIVTESRKELFTEGVSVAQAVRSIADRAGLRQEIDRSSPSPDAAQKRWGNVEGILQTFARRDARGDGKSGLGAFLHALTLDFGSDDDQAEADAVTLSTLHGSKGLEFDIVFLIGCEEGFLPHSRTLDTRATDAAPVREGAMLAMGQSADIEEERRLFYVGVTRAKEQLFLCRAKARVLRGKPVPRTPSRFLMDVPAELLDEEEVRDEAAMTVEQLSHQANALLAALDALGGSK